MRGIPSQDWIVDCIRWRKQRLNGWYAHWCDDWDGLPVDCTTPELYSCVSSMSFRIVKWANRLYWRWRGF